MLHAFFVGRALATALNEQVEQLLTQSLSRLGQFDAEQRDQLRQFAEEVFQRAAAAESAVGVDAGQSPEAAAGEDLQAMIDNLRAEIAQARVALQQYRNP
jgi:hypothetical protein